jgi:hypothetical protein
MKHEISVAESPAGRHIVVDMPRLQLPSRRSSDLRTRTAVRLPPAVRCTSLLLLAAAPGCSAPPVPESVRVVGAYVDVTCGEPCGNAAEKAAPFANTAVEVASELLGVEPGPAGRLHLARDEEEYERLERRITGGRFRSNLAFSSPGREMGVVAIQPPVDDDALDLGGLPMQTLRLVAHEASHLASYRAMPPPRRVPSWLEEGLAIFVELETRRILGRMPASPMEDPLLSTYYLRTAEAEAAGRLPTLETLLADEGGDLTAGELYAVRGVIFRSLMEADGGAVRSGLRAAIRAHAEGARSREVGAAFVDAFGGEARIRSVLAEHLARVRPKWREAPRSLDTSGDVWLQHPFDGGAQAVRVEDSGPRWTLSTTVRLHGEAPFAAVTLRSREGLWGFVQVSRDTLSIVRDEPREVLASIEHGGGAGNPGIVLRLEVSDSTLRVASGPAELGPVDIPAVLSGPWGLFAGEGGWLEWADLRFAPGG